MEYVAWATAYWILAALVMGLVWYYDLPTYVIYGLGKLYFWLWMHFLGEGLLGMLEGAIVVLIYTAVLSLLVWSLFTTGLSLSWRSLRRTEKLSWRISFITAAILLIPAHYWMSRQLLPLKIEFRDGARGGYTGASGKMVKAAQERDRYLANHQYLPGLGFWNLNGWWISDWNKFSANGRWWDQDPWPPDLSQMVYIYTYLPKKAYDKLAIKLFWNGEANQYHQWLNSQPKPVP
ncbi:MAG: hypothetical protein Q8N81_06805 [bacterium]|nr:hypothetical protein [bacterium]